MIPSRLTAALDRQRHLFDLDHGGLGADLCKAATDGVQYTIAAEQSPDGTPWPALSPDYAAEKSMTHPGNPMALLEGHMANPREVAGEVVTSSDRATVTYGITELAKQEAAWFQEGDNDQPARPFWGFTPTSLKEVREILDKRFSTA